MIVYSKCTFKKWCVTSLLYLLACKTGWFSCPDPSTYPRLLKSCTFFAWPWGLQNLQLSSKQETSKVLLLSEVAEVSYDWVHSGPMVNQYWRGVLQEGESEVACCYGRWELWRRGPTPRHSACKQEWTRDKMSVREWACVKDVFAPTFSSAAQGGL